MGHISLIDNGFLLTEAQNSPKHVACLQVWDLPEGKGSAWLRRLLADLKEEPPGFPFNQKLNYKIPLQPDLVTDPKVDMDYHVRHTVLPHPGDDEQLWKTVSRLHANLLDRERPLWEFHLIEGLAGRRFAFYTKIHHALADGITIARWFSESGSAGPSDLATAPIWHGEKKRSWRRGKEPTYATLIGEGMFFQARRTRAKAASRRAATLRAGSGSFQSSTPVRDESTMMPIHTRLMSGFS